MHSFYTASLKVCRVLQIFGVQIKEREFRSVRMLQMNNAHSSWLSGIGY